MSDIDRREFTRMLGGLGLLSAMSPLAAHAEVPEPEIRQLSRNGWVPNNPRLPVLHYRNVLSANGDDLAGNLEAIFRTNGWPPQWRNGIYTYHHYHSTAHEVLGIAAGSVTVMLGGPNGAKVTANAGDVIVLPTGTGHCRIEASGDYLVIGAYPPGQSFDICREAPTAEMTARMSTLAFPASDPVSGKIGPLINHWHRA